MVAARSAGRPPTAPGHRLGVPYRWYVRFKFLLRPSWLALTAAVFIFAVACYTLLAPWQFDRHEERKAQNAAVQASLATQPRPLAEVLPGEGAPGEGTQWSLVTITGRYLPEAEVVARLRTVQGEPAYEVLTPMRTDDGSTVLIDRGFVQPDDRVRVPSYPAAPDGEVTVIARARSNEVDPRGRAAFADQSTGGKLHTYSVSSQVVADAANMDIRPGYFQLVDGQPGVLGALPLPRTEAGPYFSYALQWIAFGTMAFLGWLYFTVRELRPGGALADQQPRRRRSVAEILAEDEVSDDRADARTRAPAPRN